MFAMSSLIRYKIPLKSNVMAPRISSDPNLSLCRLIVWPTIQYVLIRLVLQLDARSKTI